MLPGGLSCRARNGIGLPGRDFVLDGIEEADEFAVSVALHPAADLHSIEHAERCDHSVGAMTFIVARHGLAAPGIDRQTRLRVVDYLDLAFSSSESTTAWTGDRPQGQPCWRACWQSWDRARI
jgi:hypothetical protein